GPQISNLCLRSLVIGMGSSQIVMDTLEKSLSQGLPTNSSDYFLPRDNYPSWLAFTCEGPSVVFKVPADSDDCCMKGISLCVLYSSTPGNLATECHPSVLIINYTKLTIQIYKQDTVMLFNDEDWQGVVSKLGVGDNVEIYVALGHGLTVKETSVYLVYGQLTATEIEPSITAEAEPSITAEDETTMEVEPSITAEAEPSFTAEAETTVELEPSITAEAETTVEVELLSKPYGIFTRLVKRVVECLCMN
ncbi:TMV resistance protein N, partial [Trifolium medium]|nr:TMV resistance protein N [Trifolium medium]